MTETTDSRWQEWLAGISEHMHARGAHPARTVVLLPYAQLMPVAARHWARLHPSGFAPRFETTQNWCRSLGWVSQAATDYSGDAALDVLTARALLEQAGLRERAEVATPLLLESARELAAVAAAVPPEDRAAWGQRARQAAMSGLDAGMLALEAQVAQVAVAWLAHSAFSSDALFSSQLIASVDSLVYVPGWQPDPLPASLQWVWGERLRVLPAPQSHSSTSPALLFHAAGDGQDEAQRAAACVLRHLEAGRCPVAVAVTDRALTRRVRAMLASHGVQIRDETGWKLSTTRAGAVLMGALRAAAWNASSDAVLDWLKHVPACAGPALRELEAALRRRPQRAWRQVAASMEPGGSPDVQSLLPRIEAWRAHLQGTHTLSQWLLALRDQLQACGQWDLLGQDPAGAEVLQALRLDTAGSWPTDAPWSRRRLGLNELTRWVDQALESASFKPQYPPQEQVVLLPLAQMLGREFAAVVLPGCDEVRLPVSPEPAGLWTAAQRKALGLPAREEIEAALRGAWADALARPAVDVLWRCSDEGGEPLLPSPLVQLALSDTGAQTAPDLLAARTLTVTPMLRPAPVAPALALNRVSASAYQDLRHCPYRYFGLRMLGLKETEEIEGELDKRDFGLWVHAVLQRFHALLDRSGADRAQRRVWLDVAASEEAGAQRLAEDEFLPFWSAWPRMREGYLDWLTEHEAAGWRHAASERDAEQALGALTLFGRLDRVDHGADGLNLLIDYKTEAQQVTRDRIRDPLEDTQLAFYAALQPEDRLRAAYVNVGERDGCRTFEQEDVVAVRDALIDGLIDDFGRIAGGAALPALGEGKVCETCAARGLCRKDFWADEVQR